jgi:hypothetical protein
MCCYALCAVFFFFLVVKQDLGSAKREGHPWCVSCGNAEVHKASRGPQARLFHAPHSCVPPLLQAEEKKGMQHNKGGVLS